MRWIDGENATAASLTDLEAAARSLGDFVLVLRSAGADGAPHGGYRALGLPGRDADTREAIDQISYIGGMTENGDEDKQEITPEVGSPLDACREGGADHDRDWGPLHDAMPVEHCDGFGWAYRVEWNSEVIEVYKHGITRAWLHLDHSGHAYFSRDSPKFPDGSYENVPVQLAVDAAFSGIEDLGYTRETAYPTEHSDGRRSAARDVGSAIVS